MWVLLAVLIAVALALAVVVSRRLGTDRRTDGEAALRLVGAELEGHLTPEAVGLADPPDHHLDGLGLVHGFRQATARPAQRSRSTSTKLT